MKLEITTTQEVAKTESSDRVENFINDYLSLDKNGKRLVSMAIDHELLRCYEQKTNRNVDVNILGGKNG